MAVIAITQIARYLASYVEAYRQAYCSFVSSEPSGGGYPTLQVSPYLYSTELFCLVARDGYAIADFSRQPEYRWEIAGGPALLTDFPDSRVPAAIIELLKAEGIFGKPTGLYRIVAKSGMPDVVWRGDLGSPIVDADKQVGALRIHLKQYDISWLSLVQRLTFGAYGLILDVKLPRPTSPFWQPHITRDLGFVPADRNNRRFFHYLELSPHLDDAAWDERTIPARIPVDLRRDFAHAFAKQYQPKGGTIAFGPPSLWISRFRDRLLTLANIISQFSILLREEPEATESVFHQFLEKNPIMLDVYGEIKSKPRFIYPPGESPLGKQYVEPDFIICYPNNSYKLVELERPSKNLGTVHGEPQSAVTQAAFQISEWKTYILKHYDQIKGGFLGISLDHKTMIVISRATEKSVGRGRKVQDYLELIKNQVKVDEVFTYDDLLQRAISAYARLSALASALTK